jgi:hypothetical protein
VARGRAKKILNYRKPEHPPDIYFIRRKPELLDKYLDHTEMNQIIKEAQPKFKLNYNLFALSPEEKTIQNELRNRKRNFFNPDDVYYKRKIYSKGLGGVYETEKVMDIIQPLDHSELMNCTEA